ncbi:MAG: glycosyltransferase [Verrucomicrobiota bacterium]
MPPPADIIAFCKDWTEPATSVNHVMAELAKRHRVLWINSMAMRNANLASAHDLKKIFRKFHSWFRGTQIVHEHLRTVTPVSIPLPKYRLVQRLNQFLVRVCIRRAAKQWGFTSPQLWIFPPNSVDFIGAFGESLVVYYCVDDWSGFSYLNAGFMVAKEKELLAKAAVVFVTARKLLADKQAFHPRVHLIPHGVNFDMFAKALSPELPIPADLQVIRAKSLASKVSGLQSPTIGFYGNLYDWVDQDLIARIAAQRPHWSVVLIGKIMSDITTLQQCPNIHILGPRPYADLPAYCKGFDVGLIPYKTADPRMQSVNPLKLREYLAAGLPVVSVDLPEVRGASDDVFIAQNVPDFILQIETALTRNSAADRQRRSHTMLTETWTARVATIEHQLADLPEVVRV